MWEDEVVNEVRIVREAYAARFNYDLDAMYQDIKQREHVSGHKVVTPLIQATSSSKGNSVSETSASIPGLEAAHEWPADVPPEATTYNSNRYKLHGRWYLRHSA